MLDNKIPLRVNTNTGDSQEAAIALHVLEGLRGLRVPFARTEPYNISVRCTAAEAERRMAQLDGQLHSTTDQTIFVGKGVYFVYSVARMKRYVTVRGILYLENEAAGKAFTSAIEALFADVTVNEPMFRLLWHISLDRGETRAVVVEEQANDVLHNACYPSIGNIRDFVHRFLRSDECVLLLIGPPGTGKTRLIRYILGEAARMVYKNPAGGGGFDTISDEDGDDDFVFTDADKISAVYTNDEAILTKGKIFADFLVGDAQFLVIEDADHLLRSRQATGNDKMHFFLGAADGIIRSQGRKIIFSTNLPNITDVDDALVRPGRCFAVLHLKHLTPGQASLAASAITGGEVGDFLPKDETTLAEVYKWANAQKPKPKAEEKEHDLVLAK